MELNIHPGIILKKEFLEELQISSRTLSIETGITKSIMNQIERYYDVEVEFRDDVPYRFVAKISRDVNVSAFLQKLELTNLIHFKIEGKKIIVMK